MWSNTTLGSRFQSSQRSAEGSARYDDHAVVHDRDDPPRVPDVPQRIGAEQYEIRDLAGRDDAERVPEAEEVRGIGGRGLQRCERRETRLHEELELIVERGARHDAARAEVGAGEHANVVGLEARHERRKPGDDRRELLRCEDPEAADRGLEPGAVPIEMREQRVERLRLTRGWLDGGPPIAGAQQVETFVGRKLEVLDAFL